MGRTGRARSKAKIEREDFPEESARHPVPESMVAGESAPGVPSTSAVTSRSSHRAFALAQTAYQLLTRGLRRAAAIKQDPTYWVIPGVLGGRRSPECVPWDVGELVKAGVGGIVSLDGPIRTRELALAGIHHLPAYRPMLLLPTEDDHKRFLQVMPHVLQFVDARRRERAATVVHCYYGCDRTGTVLACYLVAREHCSADQAVDRVQQANPDAMWAVGYTEAVYTFQDIYRANPSLFEGTRDD